MNIVLILFSLWHLTSSLKVLPPFLTENEFDLANKIGFGIEVNGSADYSPRDDINYEAKPRSDPFRTSNPWPAGKVTYTLNKNLSPNDRIEVALAIKNFEENTCIRFVPKGEKDKMSVDFQRDDDTCGLATFNGGFAKFGGTCANWRVMVHELMHSLCFPHEQDRHDRDNWMAQTNCLTGKVDNAFSPQELMYDYRSVTHYICDDCIKPKAPGATGCGSPNGLSVLDMDKVNALYDCRGCFGHRWRNGKNNAQNLVISGYDLGGEEFVPCRAYHNGEIIPGKGVPEWGACCISYGGAEYCIWGEDFEVLTNPYGTNLKWIKRMNGSIPPNAIKAGRIENANEILYIGRCLKTESDGRKSLVLGKIHLSANPDGMYFGFAGREHSCKDHEVLVCEK